MDTSRPCGCKGRRTCLICEKDFNIVVGETSICKDVESYIYCPLCNTAWEGWNLKENDHPNHIGHPFDFPGIYIDTNFLSDTEELNLINNLDDIPWDLSQSGRRKQNFGPKCNFRKRKLKLGDFRGFPATTKFVQDKFEEVPIMKGFQTIEQCSLEYDPERGASIDPHIDDCWIWGERIITVNLLSDSVLTMTYNKKIDRYNLDCVQTYPSVLTVDGKMNTSNDQYVVQPLTDNEYPIVRIPMPRRSLLVMYGAARYNWEHRILREDIHTRRVCLAYREFTPPYLDNGCKFNEGDSILKQAKIFH